VVASGLLVCSTALLGSSSTPASAAASGAVQGAVSGQAQTGSIGPGKQVELQPSEKPFVPNAAQLAARQQLMANLARHFPQSLGKQHTTSADVAVSGGPETNVRLAPAPNDFTIFKSSLINSICSGCGQSNINEPSS